MQVFQQLGEHDYEKVVFCNDNDSGLRAIIAIHDTTLGPALGGVRMLPYATEEEALEDVLRLSRGMTYKAAISGVDLGGGKSVIIGDARIGKNPALLRAMGRFVNTMAGEYIAGQDIGTNSHDMAVMRGATKHVACVNESAGGAGDPSRTTAYGVSCGIRAVLKATNGSDSIGGRHIVVQGLGNVGLRAGQVLSRSGGAAYGLRDLRAAGDQGLEGVRRRGRVGGRHLRRGVRRVLAQLHRRRHERRHHRASSLQGGGRRRQQHPGGTPPRG